MRQQVKYFLTSIFIGLMLMGLSQAQTRDEDGILGVKWVEPSPDNQISHYELSYILNGVSDSISFSVPSGVVTDSAVILINWGDWSILKLRAVNVFGEYSDWVSTDTVFKALPTGIPVDPPTGLMWITD